MYLVKLKLDSFMFPHEAHIRKQMIVHCSVVILVQSSITQAFYWRAGSRFIMVAWWDITFTQPKICTDIKITY